MNLKLVKLLNNLGNSYFIGDNFEFKRLKYKTAGNIGSYKMRVIEGLQVQCFLITFV